MTAAATLSDNIETSRPSFTTT
ncbi:hypothetical protein ESCNG_100063 [Neisseria gonorrhoeae]|uniref:Uncharacterized protein n=1 Tax=Neisseria gonorrhoeae TaxID=485 RepID=A0AB74ES56_NEIGO|nr:hypothetical protein ESCNG_100063 [Neisseria gonorrhoeae]SCW09005.1 hypothetical protein ESCNG_100068 [Neisseria gonorrhoeae]SCW14070.1 hypothetical protein ESCNG_230012 [Neisseria gonorrhoeae]SCW14758.1 hypothetical protein ESCNG_250006 [Neisseria gonorrhoeae]SCW17256.1 hypothetical protein ESCNG_80016 [Neisseria gonorrhoeae]